MNAPVREKLDDEGDKSDKTGYSNRVQSVLHQSDPFRIPIVPSKLFRRIPEVSEFPVNVVGQNIHPEKSVQKAKNGDEA